MEKIIINFKELSDIENFIRVAEKYSFDIILSQGRYGVNGKSLMGILSLDTIKPIDVIIENEDNTVSQFVEEIKPYFYVLKKLSVAFKNLADVENFTKIADTYDFDVILSQGKYNVSGKSLMGIFSLDITQPINVIIESNNISTNSFVNEIKDYIV